MGIVEYASSWLSERSFFSAAPLISIGTYIIFLLYQIFLHPLRRFPGPFLAKVTPLLLVYQCRQVRRSEWVLRQHRKYGDIVRIAPNHVSIANPEAVSQIYGYKGGFTKGPFYQDMSACSATGKLRRNKLTVSATAPFQQVRPVLFNTRDLAIHSRKRKYLNPAFSNRNLAEFEPQITSNVQALIQALRRTLQSKAWAKVDFCMWSNFLAFDVIADYAFGAPFGFLKSGRDDLNLITTIDNRGEVFNALGHLPLAIRPFMRYFYLDRFWYGGLRASSNLVTIGVSAYEKRIAQEKVNDKYAPARKDLMSFLIKAKDPDTGLPLSGEEIKAEAISFIVGGSDTTSSTMTNFVDFVSRDMGLQGKMYLELREAFPGPLGEDWVASYDIANKLPYLTALLKETMRVRPTSSTGLERVTPQGGATVAGAFFPAETLISVPTIAIHKDARAFANPDTFDPDRWLAPNASDLMEHFIPFSVGPRACIGRNFAWTEIIKTLATIFRLFEVTRARDTPSDLREGFFSKIGECEVFLKPRAA